MGWDGMGWDGLGWVANVVGEYRTPAAAATRSTIRRLREIAEV